MTPSSTEQLIHFLMGEQGEGQLPATVAALTEGRVAVGRADWLQGEWQWCCCVVHARCCLHAHPLSHPGCPQTVELELHFAGNMSGNVLHMAECIKYDVPHARSCLLAPRQWSTQTSQYQLLLLKRCQRLHRSHGHCPLSTYLKLKQAQHHPTHQLP
jgi:hypothetical protein